MLWYAYVVAFLMWATKSAMKAALCLRLVVFLLASCLIATSASAIPAASDVRVGVHEGKTRLVIDLTERVDFSIFTLANPARVVIDMPDISWQAPGSAQLRTGGLIAGLRFGRFRPGNARVVLDLRRPAKVAATYFLPSVDGRGHRYVLDLTEVSEQAFVAALVPPKPPPAAARSGPPIPRDKPRRRAGDPFVIIIDPGHGGVDPGAIGIGGTYEKTVTLGVGKQLAAELRRRPNFRVFMTRTTDTFLTLRQRVAFAREKDGDLFISIHADSIKNPRIRGGGVYTLSETASDKEAAELAAKENRADVIAGINLSSHDDEVASILIDLTQRETMNYSARFANTLIPELSRSIGMRNSPHRFAGFRVLKAPDVPSVLVELGYLSNRQDERMLRSPKQRRIIVAAIARAIEDYVSALGS